MQRYRNTIDPLSSQIRNNEEELEEALSSIDLNRDEDEIMEEGTDFSFTQHSLIEEEDPFQEFISQALFEAIDEDEQLNTPVAIREPIQQFSPIDNSFDCSQVIDEAVDEDFQDIASDPLFDFNRLPSTIKTKVENVYNRIGGNHKSEEMLNHLSQKLQSQLSITSMSQIMDNLLHKMDHSSLSSSAPEHVYQELEQEIISSQESSQNSTPQTYSPLNFQRVQSQQSKMSPQQTNLSPPQVVRVKSQQLIQDESPVIILKNFDESILQRLKQRYIFVLKISDEAKHDVTIETNSSPSFYSSKLVRLVDKIVGHGIYANLLQIEFEKCCVKTLKSITNLDSVIKINNQIYRYFITFASLLREAKVCFIKCQSREAVCNIINAIGRVPNTVAPFKAATKFSPFCSKVLETNISIPKHQIKILPDILNSQGYIMSDGCGEAGKSVFEAVAKQFSLPFMPTIIQIRLYSFKGLLMYNNKLSPQEIIIRESMKKFDEPFLCANEEIHSKLDIIKYNQPKNTISRLNVMLLLLFHSLRVPKDYFQKLLREYLNEFLVFTEEDKCLLFLKKIGASHSTPNHQNYFTELVDFLLAGHSIQLPYVKYLIKQIQLDLITSLLKKLNIPLPNSVYLFGVCSDKVPSNCIFVKVNGQVITGHVLVTRSPCLFATDIQIMQAIASKELSYMDNCIVFSTLSEKPNFVNISGGDLDGDQYLVMWDQELVDHVKSSRNGSLTTEWNDTFPPQKPTVNSTSSMPLMQQYYSAEDLQIHSRELLLHHIGTEQHKLLGLITHFWYCFTDQHGANYSKAIQLAKLAAKAVDAAKTGESIILPFDLRSKDYPHWMKKGNNEFYKHKQFYTSTSALGMLYDEIVQASNNIENDFPKLLLYTDTDLILPDYQHYISFVRQEIAKYYEEIANQKQMEKWQWDELHTKYYKSFETLCKGHSMEKILQIVSAYYFVTNEASAVANKTRYFCYHIGLSPFLHRIKADALAKRRAIALNRCMGIGITLDPERLEKFRK